MRSACLSSLAIVFLFAPLTVLAATIHVPGEQPTIQAGIDVAAYGDTVLVAPGTYAESLVMKSGVTLRSEFGVPTTVIQGYWAYTCLRCEGVSDVVIKGIVFFRGGGTVRGRDLVGGGILCAGSEVTVADCEIQECFLAGNPWTQDHAFGAGVACLEGSSVNLEDCVIAGNQISDEGEFGPDTRGAGLYCDGLSSVELRHSQVRGNLARAGGGVGSDGPSLLVEDSALEGNRARVGGAVYGSGIFRRCEVRNNTSEGVFGWGAGFYLVRGTIEQCLIVGNRGSGYFGGGVFADRGGVTIRQNTIYGNTGEEGAGVLVWTTPQYPPVTLEGNIVAANTDGAGVALSGACPPIITIRCNDVWGNSGGNYSGCPDPTGTEGNISADPLFCDAEAGDFHLDCHSPCAPAQQPECGLIGAWGVACGTSVVRPSTWGLVKHLFEVPGR